ncbi:MAG: molybdopterin-dependent oxidoreductase [Actinobacteria bacterium]|nr:molybdopterin-dependent oxidoreductase [Actinomycetota bacterium]
MLAATAVAVVTRPGAGAGGIVPLLIGGAVGLGYLHRACRPAHDPYGDVHRDVHRDPHHDMPQPMPDTGGAAPTFDPAHGSPPIDRRRFVRLAGFGAVAAALAAVASRLVPTVADVEANRAAVRLPPVSGSSTALSPTPPSLTGASSTAQPPGAGASGSASSAIPVAQPAAAPATVPPALPAHIDPDVPGLTPYVTPDASFYRVDTAFTLPRVTTEAWHLKVHGMVERPFTIGWAELIAMPQIERWITLTCVSNEVGGNLAGNAAWQGVRIADLLARARPLVGADCVYSTSADDFTVTTPLETLIDGRDAMLAIGMNGQPLPIDHGFPVRMVVPGLYGYVSATKWVVDMEVTRFVDVTAFWTENGWAPQAPIKTASRIDTPGYDVSLGRGIVPVAGVAWAQHRGVGGVEVQVDDGPWRAADLAGSASKDTWRQWVYRWDTTHVASGPHVLRCRAIDLTGAVQTAAVAPPAPDGATGYHSVTVAVR